MTVSLCIVYIGFSCRWFLESELAVGAFHSVMENVGNEKYSWWGLLLERPLYSAGCQANHTRTTGYYSVGGGTYTFLFQHVQCGGNATVILVVPNVFHAFPPLLCLDFWDFSCYNLPLAAPPTLKISFISMHDMLPLRSLRTPWLCHPYQESTSFPCMTYCFWDLCEQVTSWSFWGLGKTFEEASCESLLVFCSAIVQKFIFAGGMVFCGCNEILLPIKGSAVLRGGEGSGAQGTGCDR